MLQNVKIIGLQEEVKTGALKERKNNLLDKKGFNLLF